MIPFVAAIWSDVRRGSDDLVLLQESSPGGNASIGSQTYAERDDDHIVPVGYRWGRANPSDNVSWAWMEVAGTWLGETLLRTITQQAGSTNFFFINPHKLALRYVESANDIYSR